MAFSIQADLGVSLANASAAARAGLSVTIFCFFTTFCHPEVLEGEKSKRISTTIPHALRQD